MSVGIGSNSDSSSGLFPRHFLTKSSEIDTLVYNTGDVEARGMTCETPMIPYSLGTASRCSSVEQPVATLNRPDNRAVWK